MSRNKSVETQNASGVALDTLSTTDRRRVQHQIRTHWNTKTPQHPFLGVDMVHVSGAVRMTQEQYATLWLRRSLNERESLRKKHAKT